MHRPPALLRLPGPGPSGERCGLHSLTSTGPEAFRPRLTASVALSLFRIICSTMPYGAGYSQVVLRLVYQILADVGRMPPRSCPGQAAHGLGWLGLQHV